MKINKLFLSLIFLVGFNQVSAQKSHSLSSDKLYQWFKTTENPLYVIDSLSDWEKKLNEKAVYLFKSYYNEKKLHDYLLLWLDKEYYIDKKLLEYEKILIPDDKYDSVYIFDEIKKFLLYEDKQFMIDSLSDDNLYLRFFKPLLKEKLDEEKDRLEKIEITPNATVIWFHSNLCLPQSYNKFKYYWAKDNHKVKSQFFIPLVKLGDPVARIKFDSLVKNAVAVNGASTNFELLFRSLTSTLVGSYGIEKMLQLIEIDKEIDPFGDGNSHPFYCDVISFLVDKIYYNNIANINQDEYFYRTDLNYNFIDSCNLNLQNLSLLKKYSNLLIEHYKQEEYYWMSNMPFYEE